MSGSPTICIGIGIVHINSGIDSPPSGWFGSGFPVGGGGGASDGCEL